MTTTSLPLPAPAGAVPQALRAPVAALVDALRSETRLLEELVTVMNRQRSAVGADDLQAVDDSVFATHRILLTLGEARRRRRALNRMIGEADELPLRELDRVLGDAMPDSLREARDGLQSAAQLLSREVEVNRTVLRRALATGDEYVRALSGAPPAESHAGYGREGALREPDRPGGLLLDRTA